MAGVVMVIMAIVALATIGLAGMIAMMIGGGIGFAVGSVVNQGWAIFGAILGGLIGIYFILEHK